jgi:4-amino-4-deoxy-L-arabinose transferase-like glycosyltransferase
MNGVRWAALVFGLAIVWFGAGLGRCGIASTYCDPLSLIPAQDDAVYAREAIDTASNGNWLTPTFMGRFVLNKPPLLQILTAASLKLFGISSWALRVPSLVAAALVSALVFLLVWRSCSLLVALGAAFLLFTNRLFYVFSRLCMTDMLLVLWTTLAMLVLAADPALLRKRSVWLLGIYTAAAVLTKAAAGFLPLIALAVHALLAGPKSRPSFSRRAGVFGVTLMFAAPWHLYQLATHFKWFVAEYLLTAHFAVGMAAPPQYSNECHPVFYARRLFWMDPVLTLVAGLGLVLAVAGWRRNTIVLAWMAAAAFALLGFRYRSGYYLLSAIPALAVLAGNALGWLSPRARAAVAALLLAGGIVKVASGASVWGVPLAAESHRPAVPALERYCEQGRGNGLIMVSPDDEFYAADLPLAGLRYCFQLRQPQAPPIDWGWLGIWLRVRDFNRLAELAPVYRRRLDSFGLHSDAPIATVIWAETPAEVAELVQAHPETDFSMPEELWKRIGGAGSHLPLRVSPGRVFLLSNSASRIHVARPCRF